MDYNTVTIKFETSPEDIKDFAKDAYDLCPDLVQMDEDVELPLLEKQLPEEKKLTLWWD